MDRGTCCFHSAVLCRNFTLRIDDPLLQLFLIGKRLPQSVVVITGVDYEEQVALLHKRVVFNGQLSEAPTDLRGYLDEVCPYTCVVSPGVALGIQSDKQQCCRSRCDYSDKYPASELLTRLIRTSFCHTESPIERTSTTGGRQRERRCMDRKAQADAPRIRGEIGAVRTEQRRQGRRPLEDKASTPEKTNQ